VDVKANDNELVVVNIFRMHSLCSYSSCGRVFAVYPKFLNFFILSLHSFGVFYDFSFVPTLEVNAQRNIKWRFNIRFSCVQTIMTDHLFMFILIYNFCMLSHLIDHKVVSCMLHTMKSCILLFYSK